MTREQIEKLVCPPIFVGPDTVVLSPPIGSVDAYMAYLHEHRDDYARFFGYANADEMARDRKAAE